MKYEPTHGAKAEPQQQAARIQFTDEEKKSEDSLRVEVAREVAIANNRLAKERAVKLADEGRSKDAADVLRSQAAQNSAAPAPRNCPGSPPKTANSKTPPRKWNRKASSANRLASRCSTKTSRTNIRSGKYSSASTSSEWDEVEVKRTFHRVLARSHRLPFFRRRRLGPSTARRCRVAPLRMTRV